MNQSFRKILLFVGAMITLGGGCGASSDIQTALHDYTFVSRDEAPAKASPAGVHTDRRPIQNKEILKRIDDSLLRSTDFTLLQGELERLGYDFTPSSSNYIVATAPDGSPLVGLSYRKVNQAKTQSALLVSFYPPNISETWVDPKYVYLEVYDIKTGAITVIWADEQRLTAFRSQIWEGAE